MAPGDLIPPAMVAVLVAGAIAGLVGRGASWAMLASFGLFLLSLRFPQPGAAAQDAALHLHWFPVSLLLLILTIPVVAVTTGIGYGVRAAYAAARVRRARRGA